MPAPRLPLSRRACIARNREEYGLRYLGLRFLSARRRPAALANRQALLDALAPQAVWSCGNSKIQLGELAPGCRHCAAGSWSCLFINGRCNAACPYCPTPQDVTDIPGTNNLRFRLPDDYGAYLRHFGFTGASVSGGEPLLTPQRTLAFLRAMRRALGDSGHLWLYTNGILLTPELARALRDAGLDELRCDIGATGYRLERLQYAAGIIPTLTVEIPVMPDEEERLGTLLRPLEEAGVQHLNLHQLRLTPHNYRQMAERGFTFLHGEKVTVLESELAALRLMLRAREEGSGLGINYCSSVFKLRHQQAAARRRAASAVLEPWESLTEAGYIRQTALAGAPVRLNSLAQQLASRPEAQGRWQQTPEMLQLHPELLPTLLPTGTRLLVGYCEASQRGEPTKAGLPLTFGQQGSAWVVRQVRRPLAPVAVREVAALVAQPSCRPWEGIAEGLQDYF